jgi:hypothetical protein
MVSDLRLALQALHEVLVAARNIGLTTLNAAVVTDIVDSVEPIPLWIADPIIDRTADVLSVLDALASEHEECRMAANTAAGMRAQ